MLAYDPNCLLPLPLGPPSGPCVNMCRVNPHRTLSSSDRLLASEESSLLLTNEAALLSSSPGTISLHGAPNETSHLHAVVTELTNTRPQGWRFLWLTAPKTLWPLVIPEVLARPTPRPSPRLKLLTCSLIFSPFPDVLAALTPTVCYAPSSSKLRCCQGSTRAPILQSARTGCYAEVLVTRALLQSAKMLVQRVLLPKGGCVCVFFLCLLYSNNIRIRFSFVSGEIMT